MLFGIWRIFDYSKLGRMLNNETTGTGSKATKRRHDEERRTRTKQSKEREDTTSKGGTTGQDNKTQGTREGERVQVE